MRDADQGPTTRPLRGAGLGSARHHCSALRLLSGIFAATQRHVSVVEVFCCMHTGNACKIGNASILAREGYEIQGVELLRGSLLVPGRPCGRSSLPAHITLLLAGCCPLTSGHGSAPVTLRTLVIDSQASLDMRDNWRKGAETNTCNEDDCAVRFRATLIS